MAQKQFRLTSEEFRRSFRQEMSTKFEKVEHLFFDVFLSKGYGKDSTLTSESDFFEKDKKSEVLLFLLDQVQKHTGKCTTRMLVSKILDTIEKFHLDNQEDQVELTTLIDYQKSLASIYDRTAGEEDDDDNTKSFLEMYHIKNPEFVTDIFRHYQIKYKARLIQEQSVTQLKNINRENLFKSIYDLKSAKLWKEQYSDSVTHLEITVLGKRKQQEKLSPEIFNESRNDNSEDHSKYHQLSKVVVDFNLIYACIHPKAIDQKPISTKVNIQYKDQTPNAPYKGLTTIQIGFNFLLNSQARVYLMDKLTTYFDTEINKIDFQIKERVNVISEILHPFTEKIIYKSQKGLEENKIPVERGMCSIQQCTIF